MNKNNFLAQMNPNVLTNHNHIYINDAPNKVFIYHWYICEKGNKFLK